jgi:hypothetical protein
MSEPIHGRSVTVRGMIVRASGCETILCRGYSHPAIRSQVRQVVHKTRIHLTFVHREM